MPLTVNPTLTAALPVEFANPRVGVAIWIIHEGKVLMNYRTKPHGGGTWACPGGHLEMYESPEECASREALEEAGLQVSDIRLFGLTNDVFPESGKHYITLHMEGRSKTAAFVNNEPEKYKDYRWFAWNELPSPLFSSTANLLKQKQKPSYLSC